MLICCLMGTFCIGYEVFHASNLIFFQLHDVGNRYSPHHAIIMGLKGLQE